ncbi:MAG: cupin domain-containing protein [Opitutaceae bacterium]|nr:cupin domain-containing protein [Opitutaceae bacterium]
MNPINGHFLIPPGALAWKVAKPMQIPYADLLEHTKSEILGARLWRLPPGSANTWHRHVRAEEFYFVLEGVGRMRVANETLTVPKHGGVLVGPQSMRQIFNDTGAETLWLILGAPEKEFAPDEPFDIRRFWPEDPTQLPKELAGVVWPPKGESPGAG